MTRRALQPIDMPQNDLGSYHGYDENLRAALTKIVESAYAEGRWRTPENILWNPRDPNFVAYWAQKCMDPITAPMADAGLEEHFRPFTTARFDLTPEGFFAESEASVSAVGDLMPTAHLEVSRDRLFREVEHLIFGADCAFGNLECTIAPRESHDIGDFEVGETPILNVTQEQYATLTHHCGKCFDVLQLANNHVLDGGAAGISNTIAALRRDGIEHVGVYDTEEASLRPKITKVGDLSVGWVAHTYCVNGKPLPEGMPWMIDMTPFHVVETPDLSRICRQVEAARRAGCDFVFVCLHWGPEWEFYPLPVQLDWAHTIAEAGADAIIGTHPHVIQPVEIYQPASAPWKSVPILYSLGNLTPTMSAAYTTLSLVANLALSRGHIGREQRTVVTGLELTPIAFMGEREAETICAACIALRDLNAYAQDDGISDYVETMNGYADLVLGKDWRKPAGP